MNSKPETNCGIFLLFCLSYFPIVIFSNDFSEITKVTSVRSYKEQLIWRFENMLSWWLENFSIFQNSLRVFIQNTVNNICIYLKTLSKVEFAFTKNDFAQVRFHLQQRNSITSIVWSMSMNRPIFAIHIFFRWYLKPPFIHDNQIKLHKIYFVCHV